MKILSLLSSALGIALMVIAAALILYIYWLAMAYFLIAVACLALAGLFLEGASRCGP